MIARRSLHPIPGALVLSLMAGLLAGCEAPDDVPVPVADADHERAMDQPGQTPAGPGAGEPDERDWSAAGLEYQPRLSALRAATPDEMGWEPGTTPWRPAELAIPPEFTRAAAEQGAGFDSPGELLARLGDALGLAGPVGEDTWELSLRVLPVSEDEATGMILLWGFKDDAVAGGDYRVHLARVDGRWYAERMEQRFHCRRGVTEDGLCA
jgi:hypothetical protein